MANQKEQLIAKLATGTFSDEVLEQAMLALTQKTQPLTQVLRDSSPKWKPANSAAISPGAPSGYGVGRDCAPIG